MGRRLWGAFGRAFVRKFKLPFGRRPERPSGRVILKVEALEHRIALDDNSAGVDGINARGLTTPGGVVLVGSGVNIGQVEPFRPGLPGFDSPDHRHLDVVPVAVYLRDDDAVRNQNTHSHAEAVAGIMISSGRTNGRKDRGVAPAAGLWSSAATGGDAQTDMALSFQHLVNETTSNKIRVMNFSALVELGIGEDVDGSSLPTKFVDWSARFHNILYVVAGYQDTAPAFLALPTDEYNGLTVGYTRKDATGVFRLIDPGNDYSYDARGTRTSIDLVAPGDQIRSPRLGGGAYQAGSGTSYATPHVSAAAALLLEYSHDRQVAVAPRWATTSTDHLVLKAVLMNSADKIQDLFDGMRLGMEKTIVKKDGTSTWEDSDARDEPDNLFGPSTPLDLEMGAGQLNARRALQQYSPGEYERSANIPEIGWNYDTMAAADSLHKYVFDLPLKAGSYVSLTLTWDRAVTLNDEDDDDQYDAVEDFTASPLVDFDLHLLPKGATSTAQARWSSISTTSNVEHIFFQLPADDQYEFWVRRFPGAPAITTNYAVAWWALPLLPPAPGRIGDVVWHDQDLDGIKGVNEPGVTGVRVDLHKSDGTWVAVAWTGPTGSYSFDNVAPGDYYLSFVAPDGYAFTLQDAGTDDGLDSDVNAVGRTAFFTVGTSPVLTLDAGLVRGQWASSVLGFSSQFSDGSWSAEQALGEPDTFTYGGAPTAWTAASMNGTQEYLTVGFDTPVYATGVTVRQTFGNGFVTQVDLRDVDGVVRDSWSVVDPSQPGSPADFVLSFPATSYLVQAVTIHVNTDHDLGVWEEIDAVLLHGSATGGGLGGFAAPGGSPKAFSGRSPNVGPFAALTSAGPAALGLPATFLFTGQRDASGAVVPASAFTYSFDFNNDGDFTDPGEVANGTLPSAAYTFATRGWHVVRGLAKGPKDRGTEFYTKVFVP